MSNKRKKRHQFTDSQIHDALDAAEMSITRAADYLGVHSTTLYRWINSEDNLRKYRIMQIESHALMAREKIAEIIKHGDHLDPRQMSAIIGACKIFMDKAEANKLSIEGDMSLKHGVDKSAAELIDRLINECLEDEL
jgi:hypothetical protein